jgi:hypothetical protein
VVREHRIFAEALAKMMCHAFRKSSGVHKYQVVRWARMSSVIWS